MTFDRSDDMVIALQQAVALFAGSRYALLASTESNADVGAANRVTQVADVFVDWLREPVRLNLSLVDIEEQDTGESVPLPPGGTVTTIDTSQQARYVISASDDRGFPVDTTLTVTVEPAGAVDATITEAASGTASGKDELVVAANATGPTSALVTVADPANPTTIFGSDSVDVVAGGVAAVVLETPTVEEQPAPPTP